MIRAFHEPGSPPMQGSAIMSDGSILPQGVLEASRGRTTVLVAEGLVDLQPPLRPAPRFRQADPLVASPH